MKVSEFVERRNKTVAPVDPSRGQGSGGLIPTDFIRWEDEGTEQPNFLEAPEKPPEPPPKRANARQVVPQQPLGDPAEVEQPERDEQEEREELNADLAGDRADADRMLLRIRVVNTFGNPLKDCFVTAVQNGTNGGAWTSDNGLAEFLVVRPIRTEEGKRESDEIAKSAEGKLTAPPPPAMPSAFVDVQAVRNGATLSETRLYFRDVPENANDAHWNGKRIIQETGADHASFDLVVETGRVQD